MQLSSNSRLKHIVIMEAKAVQKVLRLICSRVGTLGALLFSFNVYANCADLRLLDDGDDFLFVMYNDSEELMNMYESVFITACKGIADTNFCYEIKDEKGNKYSNFQIVDSKSGFGKFVKVFPGYFYGKAVSKKGISKFELLDAGIYYITVRYNYSAYDLNYRKITDVCHGVSNALKFKVEEE